MSVFTFDPDPPRVSSPWQRSEDSGRNGTANSSTPDGPTPYSQLLPEYGVTALPSEPQEGPIEYKLHLLLRPRKAYRYGTTVTRIPQSQPPNTSLSLDVSPPRPSMVPLSSSDQTRQDRCQQLTTQLLWRLRQSSPYHASTSNEDILVPLLPDDSALQSQPVTISKLAAGLEESRGALYEIGVADDGSLVGITKDELDQSIATLRWMAATVGCKTEIQRTIAVGECEWDEESPATDTHRDIPTRITHREQLWVAEVLVQPDLSSRSTLSPKLNPSMRRTAEHSLSIDRSTTANQLRVTLTGPTTSGKSTLLGTLSTGTLDDGKGKSRQSSQKHLHELASGLTSTVTQELLGYRDNTIVNYANRNIESWIGIHDYTKEGRLVLISDSAGHPRYRRTTLRGMIGWSPHWTIVCMAADHTDARHSIATTPLMGAELAKAHLELCLKLELPLAILITKSDLLNKESLRRTLVPIWTAVKNAGRVPQFVQSKDKSPEDLRQVPTKDQELIQKALSEVARTGNFLATIPVILTSAVSGDGIGLLHALLENLPLPPPPTASDFVGMALNPEQPTTLFHIEEKFSLPASYASVSTEAQADHGTVVGGYLRFGSLSVGDTVVVGPFLSGDDELRGLTPDHQPSPGNYGLSISHPSASELNRIALRNAVSASAIKGEWYDAKVVSIRNLRLPVQALDAGQVGTVGLVFDPPNADLSDSLFERPAPSIPKLRKGMVLAVPSKHMLDTGLQLQAASGLTAFFDDANIASLAVGTGVTFYAASVRAQARIIRVSSGKPYHDPLVTTVEDMDDIFDVSESLEDEPLSGGERHTPEGYEVKLELLYGREWIELGSRIVILEGANKDGSALDGFVGRVVEIVD